MKLLHVIGINPVNSTLFFEYPTPPKGGREKASITDLMILADNFKIAIEAKFTEYVGSKTEYIQQWLENGERSNRNLVLQYWKSLILPFSYGIKDDELLNIEYQFFHRSASACKDTSHPVVV